MVVELFLRGDQIATYSNLTSGGNGDDMAVTLTGVQPLGLPSQIFRIVVRQENPNDPFFNNGQFVDIYAWPAADPPAGAIFTNLNPQHDQFQGRASSGTHEIFTNPANVVFQTDPIVPGTLQYGPGANPPRVERLPFKAFPSEPPVVPCFVAGTMISTPDGPRPVESLAAGDRVITYDHGTQILRWVGQRSVPGKGMFAPIRIAPFALGRNDEVWLSPQHRILLRDEMAEILFGTREVLATAHHLINDRSIRQIERDRVTYVHLLFDAHQIVYAGGLLAESLIPSAVTTGAFGPEARAEVLALFPELGRAGGPLNPRHKRPRRRRMPVLPGQTRSTRPSVRPSA